MIEVCDKLGILVYEEVLIWINIGGEVWFDNLERVICIMICNYWNYFLVVIWGVGINYRGYVFRMYYVVK